MRIRHESPEDADTIHRLTETAFAGHPHSDGSEPGIIRRLRADGDLALSLVAEDGANGVLGHVAFSPVLIGGRHNRWFGLGPIAVWPTHQRRGIGRALVADGLSRLRSLGARGVALIGSPEVYGPMGFSSNGRLRYGDLDTRYVQHIVLDGTAPPEGALHYVPAFDASGAP